MFREMDCEETSIKKLKKEEVTWEKIMKKRIQMKRREGV